MKRYQKCKVKRKSHTYTHIYVKHICVCMYGCIYFYIFICTYECVLVCICLYKENLWMDPFFTISGYLEEWDSKNKRKPRSFAMHLCTVRIFTTSIYCHYHF